MPVKLKLKLRAAKDQTVQVDIDQENAQSEGDFHSKNRGGKNIN